MEAVRAPAEVRRALRGLRRRRRRPRRVERAAAAAGAPAPGRPQLHPARERAVRDQRRRQPQQQVQAHPGARHGRRLLRRRRPHRPVLHAAVRLQRVAERSISHGGLRAQDALAYRPGKK